MTLTRKSMSTPEIVQELGTRFREYRLRCKLTRKEVSEISGIGMTTLYRFETGNIYDMSMSTLLRLLRAVGMFESWDSLLPELPESPYMYRANDKNIQRIRHPKK